MSYKSRIPEIMVEMSARLNAVAELAAERIAEDARENVPVGLPTTHLKDDIRTKRTGIGEVSVLAGDTDTWYGHIVEHGGANSGAHPFLVPAAEKVRREIPGIGHEALRNL